MPIKDDLIERTLEQLAEVVRALSGVGATHNTGAAETALQEAYRAHTGADATLFRSLPSDQLVTVLSSAGVLDREKSFLLATLFELEATLARTTGETVPVTLQLKAFDLFLESALAELDFDTLDGDIARMRSELADFVLPAATQWRVFDYDVLRGHYADAEDGLFALLETFGASAPLATRGRSFYHSLQAKNDDALNAGGLPRAEVAEGLANFEARLVAV
ncbi:hypothetical protein BH24DEI2_BH24DEI2_02210 [soil metagenome]